ncbi:unnamed protein product [Cyprideis torosa]|uniref:Sidoreflexin n=1 Tax=Cyprideis torosa TaxID=163714 RepID=A0A7R8W8G3_9CRUS|nr:unnamed protein product [Cyprideis torosa]CAG0886195.1 unnamed protein product [Cyprideis torosa]
MWKPRTCAPGEAEGHDRLKNLPCRIDFGKPRWDQQYYSGRARHFFTVTNPLKLLVSNAELAKSEEIVTRYKRGETPDLTVDQLWHYKHTYDSAYHPETGEKLPLFGRMSSQMPVNMALTGSMLIAYNNVPVSMFLQFANQSYNALVNYSNRSGSSPIPTSTLVTSYVLATSGAMATVAGFNKIAKRFPPVIARFGPFAAVCAANAVNIPCMRSTELFNGTEVVDDKGRLVGRSKQAAVEGISLVLISRILMAAPGMVILPLMVEKMEKKGMFQARPWINPVFQILGCGALLVFTTPLCCAIWPQQMSVRVDSLEPEIQQNAKRMGLTSEYLTYNKGL